MLIYVPKPRLILMETILTSSPGEAAGFLINGGVVAFPTETVYGLGANVFSSIAVGLIFEAKRRPPDNPLIAHIGNLAQIGSLASEITPTAQILIEAFFPGPLTVVLKKAPPVPDIATAGLDTIGIRMPRNELAREFLMSCGTPVVAPSANLSGRPSPTTWQAVYEDLNGRIDCILQGEPTEIGLESTVVDCTGDRPVILRQGAITLEQVRSVVPGSKSIVDGDVKTPKSPGLKHRHYSPTARVVLVDDGNVVDDAAAAAFIGMSDPNAKFGLKRIVRNVNEYAHEIFEFFRMCDREGIALIYCEAVPEQGIGAALMDRIRRASQG